MSYATITAPTAKVGLALKARRSKAQGERAAKAALEPWVLE